MVRYPSRPDSPCIPLEGRKQILELATVLDPELVLISNNLEMEGMAKVLENSKSVFRLSQRLMNTLSAVENNQGIVAFFKKPSWSGKDLTGKVICLDGIQDPGNLGTIIRSAAAMGGYSIVSCGRSVSFYNSKVVRASAGYLYSVPCLAEIDPGALVERGYRLLYAVPQGGVPLPEAGLRAPVAIVFGSEGSGINPEWLQGNAERLTIPMTGAKDSLNVAVASSLVMYEIERGGVD